MLSRRRFLAGAGAALLAPRAWATPPRRNLAFANTHTGERLRVDYWSAPYGYEPGALRDIDHILRDFRTGEVEPIDPGLLDLLHDLRLSLDTTREFAVISGFRSAATNALLRAHSDGIARASLHVAGKAIDVRIEGIDLAHLRGAALDLARGGVGYYPGPGFVHVDTGRVRRW